MVQRPKECSANSSLLAYLLVGSLSLAMAAPTASGIKLSNNPDQSQGQQQAQASLEETLNALLREHEDNQEGNPPDKIPEAIIQRLLQENIQSSGGSGSTSNNPNQVFEQQSAELALVPSYEPQAGKRLSDVSLFAPDYLSLSPYQYPMVPNSEMGTIKRAAALKLVNRAGSQQPRYMGYNRDSFNFGLGKRPSETAAQGSSSLAITRMGDSGSPVLPLSNFGKRPYARYDFGLGKRVASPAYPRYDFGLGKRAPNKIRYDFGLGK